MYTAVGNFVIFDNHESSNQEIESEVVDGEVCDGAFSLL